MELPLAEIIIIIPFIVILYILFNTNKNHALGGIPGPSGWPLFGNFFQVNLKAPHATLFEWSREFGSLFKIKMVFENILVVNSHEAVQELLASEDCSSRPPYCYRVKHILFKDWTDIILHPYDSNWNERKKHVTRSLNAYGTGKLKIELKTLEYIDELHNNIELETRGFKQSVNLRPLFYECIAGIVMSLMYGRKLSNSEVMEVIEHEKSILKLISPAEVTTLIDTFPLLRFLPLEIIQKPINDVNAFRKWLMDHYYGFGDATSEEAKQSILASLKQFVNKATKKPLTTGDILGITGNTIGAGFMTTTSTMTAFILIMINYPEVQENIFAEITKVKSGGESLELADRPDVPYTVAVIEETLRHSSVVPMAITHFAVRDTMLDGKAIPEGTALIPNIFALHHDERYFPEPWKFKPERYLAPGGEMLPAGHETRRRTLPFSAGRRICPGEGLARSRMFLMVTSLMQKYRFLPEDVTDIPSCDPRQYEGHVVVSPRAFKVRLEKRIY